MAKGWLVVAAAVSALLLAGCGDVSAPGGTGPVPSTRAASTPSATPTPAHTAEDTQAAVTQNWGRPIAGDEFTSGSVPDPNLWQVYNSPGNAGKGRRTPAAVTVANGQLVISGDAKGTTGGLAAQFGHQRYGRWEVRMKTTVRDTEYHPVVLLWPDSNASPTCAEVDYAEGGDSASSVQFFLHYACSGATFQTFASKDIDTTQWHNYAVDWSPSAVIGYIDGVEWFRDTVHVPTESMHQALQLDWFPDGTPTVPTKMYVDWIRLYPAAAAGPQVTSRASTSASEQPTG